MPLFVSSTERDAFRKHLPAHTLSTLPERYGCDVAWPANGQWWGVQRKEIKDFIASVQDGRLAKEIGQMRQTVMPTVVLEGRVRFTAGMLDGVYGKGVTEQQYRGMVYSLARQGVVLLRSEDQRGTAAEVKYLYAWSQKDRHGGLMKRPGPTHQWGKADNRDFQEHFLMGLPGVGPELAGRIIDRFGGVPMACTVTGEELMTVDGIGKQKAAALYQALRGE
jgi:ERCC4-type nuclease